MKLAETLMALQTCQSYRSLSAPDSPHTFCSITSKSNVKSNIKPPPPPAFRVLDYSDFDEVVMVGICFSLVSQNTDPLPGHGKRRSGHLHCE